MKKYYGVYIIIFSFIFMFLPISCTPASAVSESIVIPENLQELNLSSRLKFFLDKDNLIDEQILDKENEFVPLSETDQSGDLSDASYWLKADLTNQSEDTRNLLLEIQKPHLSSVTLYSIKNNQLIKEETLGYRFPFDTREYKHRNLVFELSLQPSASTTYLLKIQTDSFFQAPVSLWDPIAFSENNYTKQSIFGIFYGIMFAMIIYNSFLFISLKEKSYLYYILFIIGFTIMQTIWDGFAFQWLWGDFPWWALRSNSFFILWSSLFALQFARHFLQLKEKAPALNKAVTYFNSICAGCLLLPFILNVGTVTMISTVIATIFLVFIIAIALKVRLTTREAKFFIAAWTLLFAGVLLNLLAAYKILPLTNLTLYAPKIGAVVEVLVLSLGLADKIKRITKEKEQESRKYYIQTLLQNSFKQLSTIKEFKALTESGLTCLMDITQFEKGLYLMKEGTAWKCVSNAGNLEVKDHIEFESGSKEKYLYMKDVDETGNPFGLNHSSGSILAIPIHCDSHIGLFIVCSQQKEKLDSSVTGSLLSSFSDQFTALVDNINSFQALKKSAMFDHLTNLLNRKYFLEKVNALFTKTVNLNATASLLIIDIDHFKKINDTYGHVIGDKAIIYVAEKIKEICMEMGIVGRFGGEEFIVYLQDTDRNDALKISQLLLYVLHEHRFDAGGGNSINITVSIGLCSNQFHSYNTIDEMIQHADEQLYIAKNNGRDQVSICS